MAGITITELTVDGTVLPTPKQEGLVFSTNKIWSSNTGRLEQTGNMAGTIVCLKRKVEISWPPLTWSQVAVIESAVSNLTNWHTLQYTDMTGTTQTMTVYFGDPRYTQYSWADGKQYVLDVQVSAIEQ